MERPEEWVNGWLLILVQVERDEDLSFWRRFE